jgi:hypothetical protein
MKKITKLFSQIVEKAHQNIHVYVVKDYGSNTTWYN